ncbi:MAG TPA: hypothetical protein VMH49_03830 [Thermoplasmata archaeon]|nr:hypothetical protein [Thermoplasmata archaeon]
MTRAGWRLVARDDFTRTPELSPAYVDPAGELVLYNDLATGEAVLVHGSPPDVDDELRAAWSSTARVGELRPLAPRRPVEGYGTFTFPYGPISMGVPESGRFDVLTYGERILELTPIGGYKARHVLESVTGATVRDAALRIERLAGNFSASHVSAFLAAAESAQGAEVAVEALWVRALAQELQRVYNHVHVLARIAEAASQNVGAAQAQALAEQLLRVQGHVFGHRWLFGALVAGGPAPRLDRGGRSWLAEALAAASRTFDELWGLFLDSRTFVDRIQGTCPVPRDTAVRWGGVGPTLRACGVAWDDRLRVPGLPYTDLFLALPDEKGGDALARLLVREQEVRASLLLLEQMLERWPGSGAGVEPAPPSVAAGRGLGRVEGPSGDLVYDVTVRDGTVVALSGRTSSQANWPLFAAGMRDAVFTDFHFALESFGLVFAETDG